MILKENTELKKALKFLNEIGIDVIEKQLDSTFLPGLELGPNCIYIDYDKLLYPGDILHEAGHLAVATSADRKLIGTNQISIDWPTLGDEIAAILWSYAALHHLQLPLEFVFHSNGYKDSSDWYISNFNSGSYIGLPLLEWMGLCVGNERAEKEHKTAFPAMQKWLRD
ncbi:hypothetical protein [Flavobacterium sp. KACC 22761]|uniref:hypothetical protein n=1 Tax=Flavobacterium sp. KACC 22761 TaxID=3092665 RepID=UPI002A764340|nr:hypothetical protein [Flavobacterium sp. KACC 22761]WPO77940.1 hypothetical protein SCB73_16855 [Flavobacterium sp. KACC 22761]